MRRRRARARPSTLASRLARTISPPTQLSSGGGRRIGSAAVEAENRPPRARRPPAIPRWSRAASPDARERARSRAFPRPDASPPLDRAPADDPDAPPSPSLSRIVPPGDRATRVLPRARRATPAFRTAARQGRALVFDVTSTLGTALVVALPPSASAAPDAETLRSAVAREHERCHPEYGAVTVTHLFGLRPLPDGSGASQWIPITTTALRHRAFAWLMARLDVSKTPEDDEGAAAGTPTEMAFASPTGMRLVNRQTWETLVRGRGGMLTHAAAAASPGTTPGYPGASPGWGYHPHPGTGTGPGVFGGAPSPGDDRFASRPPGKRTAARRLEEEEATEAMPHHSDDGAGGRDAKRARGAEGPPSRATPAEGPPSRATPAAPASGKSRAEMASEAEARASEALRSGVAELFKHGGEAEGAVPLRKVLFAKALTSQNGFISAVEALDLGSLDALARTVERCVASVRETQKEAAVDVFDDLLGRLEALNASASHSAALASDVASGGRGRGAGFSPGVAAPEDVVHLVAFGALCAHVFKGGYKARRSLPTRVAHALIAAREDAPERLGVVGRAVVEASLDELGYDKARDAGERPRGGERALGARGERPGDKGATNAAAAKGPKAPAPSNASGNAAGAKEDRGGGGGTKSDGRARGDAPAAGGVGAGGDDDDDDEIGGRRKGETETEGGPRGEGGGGGVRRVRRRVRRRRRRRFVFVGAFGRRRVEARGCAEGDARG